MSIEERKQIAKAALDHAIVMTNPIGLCANPAYNGCQDALQRNGGKEDGKCAKCLAQPYYCNHDGRSGLLQKLKKATNYGEIQHTRTYQLMLWELTRYSQTGVVDTAAYVQKAEEMGLGELVVYWKIQLLDEKIEKIKDKLNELINKVNISKL